MISLLSRRALALALAAYATQAAPRAPSSTVFTGEVRADGGAPLVAANVSLVQRGGTTTTATTTAATTATTDARGHYVLTAPSAARGTTVQLVARRIGYAAASRSVVVTGDTVRVDFTLAPTTVLLQEIVATSGSVEMGGGRREGRHDSAAPAVQSMTLAVAAGAPTSARVRRGGNVIADAPRRRPAAGGFDREGYDRIHDNPFLAVAGNPRSTFSIDVDRASYGNVRRFLTQGQRPPADAVRIEELVNYFPYALAAPRGDDPIAITTEVAPAPWRPEHRLVRIALQARRIDTAALPPSNLVFLLDVSGSMSSPDKLPLVRQAFRLLVDQLRPQDRVAIVVYAGRAGLVLPSTPGSDKPRILEAIDRLEAGGSTAGGEGLLLAYRIARENRMPHGNNRVVLATDGDFNVGVSSDGELERLIEAKRAEGTYLTVLGVGTGNYQDAKMEKLAKVGNGNYAYLDDLAEARKVLVHELGATLHTVAKDVKLQVEFNPAAVRGYRLVGYEDRLLRDEDFADDAKDAGDVGAGHAVTALYEIVPVGVTGTAELRDAGPLRYGTADVPAARSRDELLFVQLRYKRPDAETSRLMTHVVRAEASGRAPSTDFRFAAAVAEFGMLLRDSEHKGRATADDVVARARDAQGDDPGGYRAEFVRLAETWRALSRGMAGRE